MATTATAPAPESTILDRLGDGFNTFVEGSLGFVGRLFGTANDRAVKNTGYIRPKGAETHTVLPGSILDKVNRLEPTMEALSDDALKELSDQFRERLSKGETLDDILPEAFAACREAGKRSKGMRHYDVQIVGGVILHGGNIAEMVTGEGKTLVATLPAYLNALEKKGVHVVTVNDYLARRDCEWMLPIYQALGVSAAYIQSDMDPQARRAAYECDITYGTSSEFGFDYLRDNMKPASFTDENFHAYYRQCQRVPLNYAIIDEVDNILIDEARTPLIISGPAHSDLKHYEKSDEIARKLTELERKARQELKGQDNLTLQGTEGDGLPVLVPIDIKLVDPQSPPKRGVYFEIKEKERTCHLTDMGVREAERLAGVESFYTAGNMEWPHMIDNSLKAHHLYHRDKNYMIAADPRENNQLGIIIIDEFTGRAMFGRQWSDGLHQSVEAKHKREGVQIKQETQTLATITLQNFFKLYAKLAGMTGTAMTEANEFWKIYHLDVVAVPTNRAMARVNSPDLVYRSQEEKWVAVVDEIAEVAKTGRPILIGTTDVAKSEELSRFLKRKGIKHELLNAKPENVAREAEIVAQAGRANAVTISTNMAGRGTDIILGGNPETLAWARLQVVKDSDGRPLYPTRLEVPDEVWKKMVSDIEAKEKMKEEGRRVAAMGGLHIVGTERHESRRIDNQLRGRAGRQGDPGSSRFYLALDDELMRKFGGERLQRLMNSPWLGMKPGEALESGLLTKQIEGAQRKVENYYFEQRKSLLEYDEVMDLQRKRTYGLRQAILNGKNPRALVLDMISTEIDAAVNRYAVADYGAASFAAYASSELNIEFEASEFRGANPDEAVEIARNRAIDEAPTFLRDVLEENLNPADEPKDWKWQELARVVGSRYGIKVDERALKNTPRDEMETKLLDQMTQSLLAVDLSAGTRFLHRDYPAQSLAEWARQKFGVAVPPAELADRDARQLVAHLNAEVRKAYRQKDAEFPVQVGLAAYLPEKLRPDRRPDRESLFRFALSRFPGQAISEELVRTESRSKIREVLSEASKAILPAADHPELDARLAETFSGAAKSEPGDVAELVEWCHAELKLGLDPATLTGVTRDEARDAILTAYDAKYRPEMHDVERRLVLDQLDAAWKSHLLTMDHLRSVVGLQSYAQEDPKIAYKREGMKLFEEMWAGVRDRVSESVFRIEDIADEEVNSALWANARAQQQTAVSAMKAEAFRQSAPAADAQPEHSTNAGGEAKKPETIRHTGARVTRNDPCPCGSGKKYKTCHMKSEAK